MVSKLLTCLTTRVRPPTHPPRRKDLQNPVGICCAFYSRKEESGLNMVVVSQSGKVLAPESPFYQSTLSCFSSLPSRTETLPNEFANRFFCSVHVVLPQEFAPQIFPGMRYPPCTTNLPSKTTLVDSHHITNFPANTRVRDSLCTVSPVKSQGLGLARCIPFPAKTRAWCNALIYKQKFGVWDSTWDFPARNGVWDSQCMPFPAETGAWASQRIDVPKF